MTRAEAAEFVHEHGLYVSAGPVVDTKGQIRRDVQGWVVARHSSGDPRGCGGTLEEALRDMLNQEDVAELIG